MAIASASTVPVPELIRRGYDRAKGLGHDGMPALKAEHRQFLAGLLGQEVKALPAPMDMAACPWVVFEPELFVQAYVPGANLRAQAALLGLLQQEGPQQLVVSHPWLMRAVEAIQRAGFDVRQAALWVATMTVLPRWEAPGAVSPDGHEGVALGAAERAALNLMPAATGLGAAALVCARESALAQVAGAVWPDATVLQV